MKLKDTLKNTNIYKVYNEWHWRERRVSYGKDFPDKTFYIIRRHGIRAGLFSFYTTNLGSIKEAVGRNMIPVIDMQNSKNPMITDSEVGRVNAWDKFFLQPSGYNLNDVRNASNIVLSKVTAPQTFPDYNMLSDGNELEQWRSYAHKYIKLRPEIEKDINEYYAANMNGRRVLGVLCRGTDYLTSKPKNHPIQPDPYDVINECRSIVDTGHTDRIYLATEDEKIWNCFIESFPDMVISYQKHHISTIKGENVNDVGNDQFNPYKWNREYLTSIGLLARSNYLIAGAAGGTYGALLMSDGFDFCHIYQLGLYS